MDMNAHNDAIDNSQPALPKGVKRFFRFSLRSLFWAITFWSVLVCVGTRLGLVEALEVVLGLIAMLTRRSPVLCQRFLPGFVKPIFTYSEILSESMGTRNMSPPAFAQVGHWSPS